MQASLNKANETQNVFDFIVTDTCKVERSTGC
jgi:hypothetical protein